MAESSVGYIATYAGVLGGIAGWLFRSSIDVFYIRFRDRKNTEKAIRRDLASIKSVYELLGQEAFINALCERDYQTAKSLSPLATLRAQDVKADYTSSYGAPFFLLPEHKLELALDSYRKIHASRIVYSKISSHVENDQWDIAADIAIAAKPLFGSTQDSIEAALKAF